MLEERCPYKSLATGCSLRTRSPHSNQENNRSRKQNVERRRQRRKKKYGQGTLREITMFNENCEWRGTRGGSGGRLAAFACAALRRVASCDIGPARNRDAAKRYSDCALSGFADFFFSAATKGGSLCNRWSGA